MSRAFFGTCDARDCANSASERMFVYLLHDLRVEVYLCEHHRETLSRELRIRRGIPDAG